MEKFAPLNLSTEELVEYTPAWKGERFEDGRPKVPDDIIERMKSVTITQNGAMRDPEDIEEMPGFASFVRGWHPSYTSPTINQFFYFLVANPSLVYIQAVIP